MTLPLLANNVTYGLWWQETNQIIGIINNLTDGQLVVNGSVTFTNSQFSLSAPSQNITNTLALTAPSGNSLFLFSSNAVVNGTMFLTGPNSGLAVSNNANINQNLYVGGNSYSSNAVTYQTSVANNIVANVIAVSTGIITNNIVTNTLFVNTNAVLFNATAHNVNIQQANVTQGLGVSGGLTADFANLNFISTNNTLQLFGAPSLNAVGAIHATLLNGTGTSQYRAVQSQSGIIFRNDGNNFSLLTTGNVANPYTANFNSLRPFQFNVNDGSLLVDGTGAGTTFGGSITVSGPIEHANNITTTGAINANGPGNGLYVANSAFINGSAVVSGTFTVNQASVYNGAAFFTSGITVTNLATFVSQALFESTFTVNGATTLLGSVTISNLLNVSQLITASANQIAVFASSGEIQSSGFGTIQFRAVQGNFGVMLVNNGVNCLLLQTPSTTTPRTTTFNSFRPFQWNLTTGAVNIDAGGSGTVAGGPLTVIGSLAVQGVTSLQSSLGVSGAVTIAGNLGAQSQLTVLGATTMQSTLQVNGTAVTTTSGFLFNGSTPNLVAENNVALTYSIYAPIGFMFGVGFFAGSDQRLKQNIVTISPEEGKNFVTVSRPVTFTKNNNPGAGFIAQEQIKAGYQKYVGSVPYEGLEETIDEDGLISVGNVAMHLSYDNYIAYLVAFGQWSVNKIDQLEKRIAKLEGKI